jgi:hypothetical protein
MNDFTQEAQLRSVYEICLDHSLGIISADDAMKAIGGVILNRKLYYSKQLARAVQAAEERKRNDIHD